MLLTPNYSLNSNKRIWPGVQILHIALSYPTINNRNILKTKEIKNGLVAGKNILYQQRLA